MNEIPFSGWSIIKPLVWHSSQTNILWPNTPNLGWQIYYYFFFFFLHKHIVWESNQTKQTLRLSVREGGRRARRGRGGGAEGALLHRRSLCVWGRTGLEITPPCTADLHSLAAHLHSKIIISILCFSEISKWWSNLSYQCRGQMVIAAIKDGTACWTPAFQTRHRKRTVNSWAIQWC